MGDYTVNGAHYSVEAFQKLVESLSNDPTKILKEISPGNYTILNRMQG